MNALAIARRDFTDARRSKILGLTVGLFVAFVVVVLATSSTSGATPAEDALWNIQGIAIWFLPIVVLVIGYLSVAGERESGRIKYLLSLPNTRRDVILGKFLSRAAVSVLAVGLSMGIGAVVLAARYPSVPVGEFVALTLFMTAFAVVYTGVAVGISASVATRARAIGGVLGVYIVFTIFWIVPQINPVNSMSYIVEDLLGLSARPNFYEFVFHLSPSFAYSRLVNGAIFDRATDGANPVSPGDPIYLQEWFMAIILLAWLVGALAVGYSRFRQAELA